MDPGQFTCQSTNFSSCNSFKRSLTPSFPARHAAVYSFRFSYELSILALYFTIVFILACTRLWFLSTPALLAFLASAASTVCLQAEILFDCLCQPDNPLVDSYMTLWSASFGAPSTGAASHKQEAYDRPTWH